MRRHNGIATRERRLRKPVIGRGMATTVMAVGLVALVSGCSLLRAPQTMVSAVIPGGQSKGPDPLDLQVQVQRYADEFSSLMSNGIDEYARRVGTDGARLEGLRWKMGVVSAAVSIASGPHPKANLLDLVSITTLTRLTLEERLGTSPGAAAAQSWIDTARLLETNVWTLATHALAPPHLQELREAIYKWHDQNPQVPDAFFARPQEFAGMVKSERQKDAELASVFSLVNLDPTTGLDPAVREITLTRLFAERAMYTAQRMPFVLRLQTEFLMEQLARQPAIQQVLTNSTRITDSADRFSRGWEDTSRTITQLPDRLATERKEILAALEQQESKLRALASEVNQSLVSAEKMSTSLNTTLTTFDALMKRFGVGEPKTITAPATNARPFNVLDYGTAAEQVAVMVQDLNTLITTVTQSLPQLNLVSQQASTQAQQVVDRAFQRGLLLIVILLAGSVLAALAYRILVNKLARAGRPPTSPSFP